MPPFVSVVIPHFERLDYLRDTLSSLYCQTYDNYEIVLADDCSSEKPDKSNIPDPGSCSLKIVYSDINLGTAAMRNLAIDNAAGELIMPIDADDLTSPDYIAKTVSALEESGASAVYTDVQVFGSQNFVYSPDWKLAEVMAGRTLPSSLLMKRQLINELGGYDSSLSYWEDHELWIRILSSGAKVHHLYEPLFHYRKHETSKSSSVTGKSDWYPIMVAMHQELFAANMLDVISALRNHRAEIYEIYYELYGEYEKKRDEYTELQKAFEELTGYYNELLQRTSRN